MNTIFYIITYNYRKSYFQVQEIIIIMILLNSQEIILEILFLQYQLSLIHVLC
jgi:hypothetical protein